MQLEVNGRRREVSSTGLTPLVDVLRGELGMTGTKVLCRQGLCGLCTVIVDGEPRCSCLTPVGALENSRVETVEGLSEDGQLGALQQQMLDGGGLQCGICTPGMLMTLTALLRRNASPTELEIRRAMAGNLCRCTGYQQIVESVQATVGSET